jgi:hypothetical protein
MRPARLLRAADDYTGSPRRFRTYSQRAEKLPSAAKAHGASMLEDFLFSYTKSRLAPTRAGPRRRRIKGSVMRRVFADSAGFL